MRDDGAGWAPPALLEAPSVVQYMHAVTWAVGILWGISEPEPETVVQQVLGLGAIGFGFGFGFGFGLGFGLGLEHFRAGARYRGGSP